MAEVLCFCGAQYDLELTYCPQCLVATPSGNPDKLPVAPSVYNEQLNELTNLPEA